MHFGDGENIFASLVRYSAAYPTGAERAEKRRLEG